MLQNDPLPPVWPAARTGRKRLAAAKLVRKALGNPNAASAPGPEEVVHAARALSVLAAFATNGEWRVVLASRSGRRVLAYGEALEQARGTTGLERAS